MDKLSIILLILANILLVVNLLKPIKVKNDAVADEIKKINENSVNQMREIKSSIESLLNFSLQSTTEKISTLTSTQNQNMQNVTMQISELTKNNNEKMERIISTISNELEKLVRSNDQRLGEMRQTVNEKLNEMRQTVDDKLNTTLEKRLSESFNLISERLQAVYTGLGEMKNLAAGVGELKNVLTNVKNRGVMGEISLLNILKEIMTDNQYKENYQVKPSSQQRVDFAIFIPDKKGGKDLVLPIDSKFPIESYLRLCEAYDSMNQEQIQASAKELENAVKKSAKSIAEKYINVPITTDFAIMYLPIEGLYSEVVRRTGLIEEIQRNYKILITGPNTISAFLNSLQLGFKTLTIEKRSNEIWSILAGFRKEFTNFVDLLAKSQKQINTVSTTLESATKRTQMIEKQLMKVDEIEVPVESEQIDYFTKGEEE